MARRRRSIPSLAAVVAALACSSIIGCARPTPRPVYAPQQPPPRALRITGSATRASDSRTGTRPIVSPSPRARPRRAKAGPRYSPTAWAVVATRWSDRRASGAGVHRPSLRSILRAAGGGRWRASRRRLQHLLDPLTLGGDLCRSRSDRQPRCASSCGSGRAARTPPAARRRGSRPRRGRRPRSLGPP
jgi:hypothetical protein